MKKITMLALCCFTNLIADQYILPLRNTKDRDYSLQSSFLDILANITQTEVFIESGTFLGNTTAKAARFFKNVHSIELDQKLYIKAKKRFEYTKNVQIHFGNSSQVLQQILPTIHGKILFWLDGHYSGPGTAFEGTCTPILNELQAIKEAGITNAIILVDDIRFFDHLKDISNNVSHKGYPSILTLYEAIMNINPDYQFKIYGDIAIAYTNDENFCFSPLVEACTISRLADDLPFNAEDILKAEIIIGTTTGIERSIIQNLYKIFEVTEHYHEVGKHYRFWNGLTLLYQHQLAEAEKNFKKAIYLGLDEARINPHHYLYLQHIAESE